MCVNLLTTDANSRVGKITTTKWKCDLGFNGTRTKSDIPICAYDCCVLPSAQRLCGVINNNFVVQVSIIVCWTVLR